MSKRLAIAVVAFACVSLALGAAVKINSFTKYNEPNTQADGMAILRYVSGQDKTVFQLILSDFSPDTEYVVIVHPSNDWSFDTNGDVVIGASFSPISVNEEGTLDLFADSHGHLTVHANTGPDTGDWTNSHVLVFFWERDGETFADLDLGDPQRFSGEFLSAVGPPPQP